MQVRLRHGRSAPVAGGVIRFRGEDSLDSHRFQKCKKGHARIATVVMLFAVDALGTASPSHRLARLSHQGHLWQTNPDRRNRAMARLH